MGKKETTIVGLDIGSANIRAVQISFKADVPLVEKVAEITLPPDVIVDGDIADREALIDALKILWKNNKFSTNTVRLGVGGDKVVSRLAELDWENDKDFALLLPSQVKTHLLIDPKEYVIDFHTLSEYMQRRKIARDEQNVSYRGFRNTETEIVEVPKKHVLIVAAPRDLVRDYVNVAMEAGLKPISVDIKSLAILRAFSSEKAAGEEPLADVSIDVGASATTIIVHKSGQPLFTRTLQDRAGRALTQRLQTDLQLSFVRAEKRKMNVFLENVASTVAASQKAEEWSFDAFDEEDTSMLSRIDAPRGTVDRTEVEEEEYNLAIEEARILIQDEIAHLVDEIRSTLQWFRTEATNNDFEGFSTFVLSGAGAGIPSLSERLASEFRTEVVLASPLTSYQHKTLSEEVITTEHEYATALGLALGQGSTHG